MEIREMQIQTLAEPAKIKIMKMSKGYNWEISLSGENLTVVLEKIRNINTLLVEIYGSD